MYRLTAITAVFSAVMHGLVFVLGKFGADVMPMMIFTALYFYLAVFLFRQRRWMAWSTLIVGLAGLVVTLMSANSGSLAPNSVFYAAALLNFIAAVCAVVTLWTSRVATISSVN